VHVPASAIVLEGFGELQGSALAGSDGEVMAKLALEALTRSLRNGGPDERV